MDTFTVHMTDTEGEAEHIASGLRADDVLIHMPEKQASRYSVQLWRDNELIVTLNGEEWLEKYTYLPKPKRRCY